MSKVKAVYNYSYNYDGKKISFKKDEQFQLLSKSNKDWWHVRRWMDDAAQDIYVPAVYVKEVEESPPCTEELYMNLDDLKVSVKPGENEGKGEEEAAAGVALLLNVLHKPSTTSRNSIKKKAKDDTRGGGGNSPQHAIAVALQTNGLNPTKPVSPSMLRRLNRGGGNKIQVLGDKPTEDELGPLGGSSSLKRGEKLFPPSTNTKPRSKSNTDAFEALANAGPLLESSLDSSSRLLSSFGTHIAVAGPSKVRLPPPVQMKPKPQKNSLRRPISVLGNENNGGGEEGTSKPLVSELSNILMKKKPYFSDHRALTGSLSTGAVESSTSYSLDMHAHLSDLNPSPPPPPSGPAPSALSSALPTGWTEHNTSSGKVYYHNTATGQSLWTRPEGEGGGVSENKYLEKVAPRGWTKQINSITSTPIYTNSRTGERWSLASDGKGNYYYYNMANSTLTIGELPEITEEPIEETLYDSIAPLPTKSSPASSPVLSFNRSISNPNAIITETIVASLSDVLKRHGILLRKKLFDLHGKKAKDRSWLKFYVCLQSYELLFYPDMRAKDSGTKPVSIFCLLHSTICPYSKDKRKTNTFQVSSHVGEQFLLQTETSNLLNEWYSTIQSAINHAKHDYKDDADKFKRSLMEPLPDDFDEFFKLESGKQETSKVPSLRREKRPHKYIRSHSTSDEALLDEEDDNIDDMEISVADRSTHIRGRLRRLMARRPEKEQLRYKGILEDPVFGCELSRLCDRQGTVVPKFLVQFMHHIEKVGLDVVGIYRLSGNAASINKLRYLVEQDQELNLDSQEWSDVNIVTGCLKLYLRELPDPLLLFRFYKPFIDAARSPTHALRVQNIKARIMDLPNANYQTLKVLIQHLRRVVEKGSVNKMLATNVAIVFGPTVMRAETDSIEMATLMPIQNGIVEIVVNEYESIFRK